MFQPIRKGFTNWAKARSFKSFLNCVIFKLPIFSLQAQLRYIQIHTVFIRNTKLTQSNPNRVLNVHQPIRMNLIGNSVAMIGHPDRVHLLPGVPMEAIVLNDIVLGDFLLRDTIPQGITLRTIILKDIGLVFLHFSLVDMGQVW